jgi:hypothetical protein
MSRGRIVGEWSATDEVDKIDKRVDAVFEQLLALPTKTQPGTPAEVRATLVMLNDGWREPSACMDDDNDRVRAALGNLAGLSEEKLAADDRSSRNPE